MKRDTNLPLPTAPTFVWTLVGIDQRNQGEMLLLSVSSAHLFHPEAKKVCLVPAEEAPVTRERLASLNAFGCHLDVIGIDVPRLSDLHRSRWLKIQAYAFLQQSCLFLDTDTLFVGSFDFAGVRSGRVGACENRDGDRGRPFSSEDWVRKKFVACGWEWSTTPSLAYLNSGVILFEASSQASDFVSLWFENWNHAVRCTGEHLDQPAFNHTARTLNTCSLLPPSWNVPVSALPQLARSAHLFHYYSSTQTDKAPHTLWGWLIEQMQRGALDPRTLQEILKRRKPFVGLGATAAEYWCSGQWHYYAITRFISILRLCMRGKSVRSA